MTVYKQALACGALRQRSDFPTARASPVLPSDIPLGPAYITVATGGLGFARRTIVRHAERLITAVSASGPVDGRGQRRQRRCRRAAGVLCYYNADTGRPYAALARTPTGDGRNTAQRRPNGMFGTPLI